MNPSLVHAGIWSGFILCGSCACSHSYCDFLYAKALICPLHIILLQKSTPSGSYSLCPLFCSDLWASLSRISNKNIFILSFICYQTPKLYSKPQSSTENKSYLHNIEKGREICYFLALIGWCLSRIMIKCLRAGLSFCHLGKKKTHSRAGFSV